VIFTRNPALNILFVLLFIGSFCSLSFALPVKIYGQDNFDLPIPADPTKSLGPMQSATITITDDFVIEDLDIFVTIGHTNIFDLQLFIESPAKTRICLNMYDFKDQFFKGQGYIQTIFDDEASLGIEQGEAPFTGRFRPKAVSKDNLLSAFDGENLTGVWELQVEDMFYNDTGSLKSFKMLVTVPEPASLMFLSIGVGLVCVYNRKHIRR
jgi:subtilisin-like proprotein convertase family protein